MKTYPSIEEILSGEDPTKLLEVKRSIRSIFPLFIYFFGSLLGVIFLTYQFGDVWPPDVPILRHISLRWLGLIPLVFFLQIVRRRFDDLYVFGRNRIQHLNGRLSLSYRVPSIKYVDIRSVNVEQSAWGRILNYGNVALSTAAQGEDEMVLEGVVSPIKLAGLVDDFRTVEEEGSPEFESVGNATNDE